MKRLIYLSVFIGLLSSPTTSYADGGEPVPLTVKPTNTGSEQTPLAKSPILVPEVYLDGNVLTFDEALEGCTVRLLDEDETVVFSDFIEENQTSIVFPATLSGTYELQIICGSITFYCYIEL
ncbi:MAG: hypothetical protein IJ197_09930 [Bacteroidaceae bacterium]|nr:hypothetical protein [Bacteroidaceae bacterium]